MRAKVSTIHLYNKQIVRLTPHPRRYTGAMESAGLLAHDHRSLLLPVQCTVDCCSLLPITVAGPRWILTNFPFSFH